MGKLSFLNKSLTVLHREMRTVDTKAKGKRQQEQEGSWREHKSMQRGSTALQAVPISPAKAG